MKRLITYILVLLCTHIASFATPKFEVVNNLSGLRSDYISGVCQDERGFIYVATIEGLCRYDGAEIKYYSPFLSDDNILYAKEIRTIKADQSGMIWIGTVNGLFTFDTIREEFRTIDTNMLFNHEVLVLEFDSNGKLWFGNKRGLYIYDPTQETIEQVSPEVHSPESGAINIRTLFCDSRGDMWIGYWSGEVTKYLAREGRFCEIEITQPKSSISTFYEQEHSIYVGRWDGTILRISDEYPQVQIVHRFAKGTKSIPIHSIFRDSQSGDYWVATGNGIYIVNSLSSPTSTRHIVASSQQHRLASNNVAQMLYTPVEQLLWFCTRGGGLNYTSLSPKYIKATLFDQVEEHDGTGGVRGVCDDGERLWVALYNGGIFTINREGKFQKENFGSDKINTILKLNSRNELWIGNRGGGVTVVDLDKRSEITLLDKTHPNITALFEDSQGRVWIGCNNGLMMATHSAEGWKTEDLTAKIAFRNTVVGVTQGVDGYVWVATRRNGLYRVDYRDGEFRTKRYNVTTADEVVYNNILSIYCDKKGGVWLGMSSLGLLRYDAEQDCFRYAESLVGREIGSVQSIIEQGDKLWMGTNGGVYCYGDYDTASPSLLRFTTDDGVVNNISISNSIAHNERGDIYIGAHNGFSTICSDILNSTSKRGLYIADIKVNNSSILPPTLSSAIERDESGEIRRLKLTHNQRNLIFKLTSLTYEDYFNNRYSYMLEGVDEQWHESNHTDDELRYNNLLWGKYRFRARNTNLPGEDTISIDIEIRTPLYARWWAIVIYTLSIVYVIYDMISSRQIRKRLIERIQIAVEPQPNDSEGEHQPARVSTVLSNSDVTNDFQSLDEQFLVKAIDVINKNIDNSEFDITMFTEAMGVTTSMLYRKIKSLSGMSPNGLVRHVRLQVAHKLLTEKYKTITTSEVAYAVGFSIPQYFSKCFSKQFGMTPSAYRATLLDKD